jgi:DNA-directed RNA polymerase subunit RPC12/RpoP
MGGVKMANKKIIHLRYKLNPDTQMIYCGSTVIHQDSRRATISSSHYTCQNCGSSYESEKVKKYINLSKVHYMPFGNPITWCACGDYIFHFRRTRSKSKVTCKNCMNSRIFKGKVQWAKN